MNAEILQAKLVFVGTFAAMPLNVNSFELVRASAGMSPLNFG
jgi:hypothetical protein